MNEDNDTLARIHEALMARVREREAARKAAIDQQRALSDAQTALFRLCKDYASACHEFEQGEISSEQMARITARFQETRAMFERKAKE